ncbi:MAG: type II secretion system F family protein [Candidatus Nanoarchaeia archaeon]|nr:type II secretion system F family protein [Candidatus Nanoarchaeia archaeon]
MKPSKVMYKRIQNMLPKSYSGHIKKMMVYSGLKINYQEWIGFFFLYSIGLAFTIGFVLYVVYYSYMISLIAAAATFILMHLLSELLLSLSAYSRTQFIELVLPEFLSLLASNIKSGLTIDQAFLMSIRDEFGGFKDDISEASKDTLMGKSFGEAMLSMNSKMNSRLFYKTTNLIVEGINSGGNLSSLLDNVVEDLREMQLLQREIKAGVTMYALILIISTCIGAPALFGVALYEIETLQSFVSVIPSGSANIYTETNLGVNPNPVDINMLLIIVIISLVINNVFGSLMIGLLQSEKAKAGVRYIPIFISISMAVFFGINFLVKLFFPIF